MSSHYYHYLNCSICQSSNCCVCQQLEEQIEYIEYMQFQHFIQIQYLLNQFRNQYPESIQEALDLERQYHQFYNHERNTLENIVRDHKLHSPWHRYD